MNDNAKENLEPQKLDDSVLEEVSGGAGGGGGGRYISCKDPFALLYNNPADSGCGNYAVAAIPYGNTVSGVKPYNGEWMMVPVTGNIGQISMIKSHWFDPHKNNNIMYVQTRNIKPYNE